MIIGVFPSLKDSVILFSYFFLFSSFLFYFLVVCDSYTTAIHLLSEPALGDEQFNQIHIGNWSLTPVLAPPHFAGSWQRSSQEETLGLK